MNKIWKVIYALVIPAAILACGLTNISPTQIGSVSTIVAATLQALTPAGPAPTQAIATVASPIESAPPGLLVSFANVNFIIPTGLASSAVGENVPQTTDQNGAPWEVAPAYTRLTLQGYPLQDKFFQPQIMVYPAQDYGSVGAGAAISIQRLQAILANPNAPLTNDILPRLPFANAEQMIGGQPKIIAFKNGSGVSVLAMYGQGIAPINNHDLFYHFEGLSTDGRNYIVTTLPVNAPFLASSSDPASPIPTGGVPFPAYSNTDPNVFNNYFQTVTDKLNATSPEAFQPSLTALDSLIQSIQVSP